MSFENVADIYPLTPMQEGMLHHTLVAPGSGVFVDQVLLELEGELDPEPFRAAWEDLLARHAVLRTAFVWDGIDEPLQVVHQRVELPLEVVDWRGRSAEAVESALGDLLADDRARGFELESAPLLRHRLFRVAETRWRWLWSFHHGILDGWSVRLLLRELWTVYDARLRGEEPRLPPAFPFARYIAWQQEQDGERARDYWRQALAGFERATPVELFEGVETTEAAESPGPSRAIGSSHRRPSHRQQSLFLDAELGRRLTAFGREHRLTLGTLFEGAWGLLLGALSREDDVVFGLATAGRPPALEGIEEAVGLFIETLPLRLHLESGLHLETALPLVDWLRQVQRQQGEAARAVGCSLAEMRRLAELPADEPLFESLLVIENHPDAEPPEAVRVVGMEFVEQSNFPLALLVVPGDETELIAVYETARFSSASIRALLARFAHLLRQCLDHPHAPLAAIPLVDSEEETRLWRMGEGGSIAELGDLPLLPERIAAQAAERGDALAVVCGEERLDYAELDRRAECLARRLRALGVGPGSDASALVALHVERSVAMVVGILGAWKAGGAYLPLDPAYPPEHCRRILEDSGARVLLLGRSLAEGALVGGALAAWASERGIETLVLEDAWTDGGEPAPASDAPGATDASDASDAPGPGPDDLAYVIHTSGSTGRPKGVAVSHANLRASTAARDVVYGAGVDGEGAARFLLLSSFAFDSSVAGLFHTLGTGGTLVLPRPGEEKDPAVLDALVREQRVNRTLCLPSLYAVFLDELSAEALDRLETVIVAGEACPPSLVEAHLSHLPGTRLFNEYGPTEGTVWCTVADLLPDGGPGARHLTPISTGGPVPIGRPVPGARIHLLDRHRRPVPVGLAGELWISGEGVARGYLHRPEATAERFVELSIGDRPPVRAYRTGDLARWRPDGQLVFLGRVDGQVKVRGHRIETEGVAALLRERPEVAEAAVRVSGGQESQGGGRRLLAFVVPTAEAPSGLADRLAKTLGDELPAFLVPDAIHVLDSLPRLPNGKVDGRALDALALDAAALDISAAADHDSTELDATEAAIAQVWQELLGVEKVDRHSHFFRLGGDSILGIRAVSRLRQAGLRVEPRQIAAHPTVAELARALDEASSNEPSTDAPFVGELPLLPIQRWFLERQLVAPHHWNMSALFAVEVDGDPELDIARLGQAVGLLWQHHDLLRARFERAPGPGAGGGWRQVVDPPDGSVPFEVRSCASDEELEASIARVQAGFDLESGPLVRFVLFRLPADGSARLLLAAHHLVMDAVSSLVLVDDLEQLLAALAAGPSSGRPVELPPRTASVAELASVLSESPTAESGSAPGSEWREWTGLPIDIEPSPPGPGQLGGPTEADADVVRARLDADTTRALLGLADRASMEELLLTALALTLGRWRGHGRLLVDVEGHGRGVQGPDGQALDLSRTVGWLTTMEPVALELATDSDAPESALEGVREQLRSRPSSPRGVRPTVLFDYLGRQPGRESSTESAGRLRWLSSLHDSSRDPCNARSHLLELNAALRGTEGERALEVEWIYCRTHHKRETVEGLARTLVELLAKMAETSVPSGVGAGLAPARSAQTHRLTAVQEALLAHHVGALHAATVDDGLLLLRAELEGELDADRFADAWRATVDHHPALRSSVAWKDRPHPVQVVHGAVDFPVERRQGEQRDGEQPDALAAELRKEGLDLETAPVGRVILARLASDRHLWLWLCHHLLLDGWSSMVVLREVLERYRSGSAPPVSAPSFADVVAWTRGPRAPDPTDFWRRTGWQARQMLAAPRLVSEGSGPSTTEPAVLRRPLAPSITPLESAARSWGVTLGSLVSGTWGWLLARAAGSERAAFATVASGRSAPAVDLPGIGGTVGMLANALPMQVEAAAGTRVDAFFESVFLAQQEAQAFETVPMARLFEAGGVALRRTPFDSLLAFANFPIEALDGNGEVELRLRRFRGDLTSGFPLTASVEPEIEGGGLDLELRFDPARFASASVESLADAFAALLAAYVEAVSDAAHTPPSLAEVETSSSLDALLVGFSRSAEVREEVVDPRVRPLGGTDATPPETATEAQLMRIWNDLVAVQEYGVDANFFELGGHSLLVASMVERVRLDFGVELPLGVVFQQPTVRALAAAIDGATGAVAGAREGSSEAPSPLWGPLVPIRERGGQAPLFLVHGLGGEVGWFYGLANYLDPDLPLYGLQAASEPRDELEAMAAGYVEAVRSRQPEGPYRLGGYCIGGGVAFEMARQLEAAGESVELLVLIDSVPQSHAEGRGVPGPTLLARRLRHLLSKEPKEMVASVGDAARKAVRGAMKGAARRLGPSSASSPSSPDPSFPDPSFPALGGGNGTAPELDDVLDMRTLPRVYHEAARRHFRAMRDYRPGVFGGDAWLFRTRDARFAEDFGWGPFVGGRLGIEKVPGRHVDVLKEPHVRVVGEKLSAVLAGLAGLAGPTRSDDGAAR